MTENGVIYCPPRDEDFGILKIDTKTDVVTELDANLLPERRYDCNLWESCAVALDGCIYFMPYDARRIMKLDPNNSNAVTSVGADLGYLEEESSLERLLALMGVCTGYLARPFLTF